MPDTARFRFRVCSRLALVRLALLFLLLSLTALWAGCSMIGMPGRSHQGPLPPLTEAQRTLAEELQRDVVLLAEEIGYRHVGQPELLAQAAAAITAEFEAAGYLVEHDVFEVEGVLCENLIAELAGGDRAEEIVVVGAHYDSVGDIPAANDNGSGVAATLALARRFAGQQPQRTIRFLAFVNEEPPYFQTDQMGSFVYARRCKERGDKVIAMLSLETIGYYTREKDTQRYPIGGLKTFYPSTGDFITFVGNFSSRKLVKQATGTFRKHAAFPSQGTALPGVIPGVGWSDQWSFWQVDYPAIMVTDTAPYRYPYYHRSNDTPDKLDYESTARVVEGLQAVVEDLANPSR